MPAVDVEVKGFASPPSVRRHSAPVVAALACFVLLRSPWLGAEMKLSRGVAARPCLANRLQQHHKAHSSQQQRLPLQVPLLSLLS